MKLSKTIIFILIATLCIMSAKAQDKIFLRKTKGYISANILEIGLDEIKYKRFMEEDSPVVTIEKDQIEKIEYKNGRVEKFELSGNQAVSFTEMRKNQISFGFLSPLNNNISLTYERGLKRGNAFEVGLNIIGAGIKNYSDETYYYDPNGNIINFKERPYGIQVNGGYKFIFTPNSVMRGLRDRHFMHGSYFRPRIYAGVINVNGLQFDNNGSFKEIRKAYFSSGLMAEFGKQWIINNRIGIDVYVGVGYGYDNKIDALFQNPNEKFSINGTNNFGFTRINNGNNTSFAISGGLRIGYLFHTKKEKQLSLSK